MSLRQKLLLLFSLTVAASVAAVTWTVLVRIRKVFEERDQQETALFVSQFQREFQHHSDEVAAAVDRLASSEQARTLAFQIAQSGDASPYLTTAQSMAQSAQLDFLEIVGADGSVISSAQWPARFGYPEPGVRDAGQAPFLKREDLPDGSTAIGLFAVRAIAGTPGLHLIGGERLDQGLLADLPVAPGMTVGLYSGPGSGGETSQANSAAPAFDAGRLVTSAGPLPGAPAYKELIDAALATGIQTSGIVYTTARRHDSVNATVIPLKSQTGAVLAALTVAISRTGMIEAQQHIREIAYGIAGAGILLAVIFSLWIAARVSRPVEELARAAEEVAGGNWDVSVPEHGRGEVSVLARSFNHMTRELVGQRERLVQSERVAAWRELARRLAHELKNPLFPLQLTVENLVRAKGLPAADFDEVFSESTATLGAEIANLKTIIARFSDFSKMPRPELQRIDARDVISRVHALYSSAATAEGAKLACKMEIENAPMPLEADPELLHRALSNLVLNAMDAMPDGGTVTLGAHTSGANIEFRVSDTGAGLTREECERLFTPYYTTRQHGTGLGLAIVQSVVSDHHGTIAVESREGAGSTFIITLPRAAA
jgi:two-component system nitrogen regulation sensor histidine kinase NtrY